MTSSRLPGEPLAAAPRGRHGQASDGPSCRWRKGQGGPWLAVKGEKAREQGAPQALVALPSGCEPSATLCAGAILSFPAWNGGAASEVRAAGVEGGEPRGAPPTPHTCGSHTSLCLSLFTVNPGPPHRRPEAGPGSR